MIVPICRCFMAFLCRRPRLGPIAQMRTPKRQVGRSQTVGGSFSLVPEGVDQGRSAHLIQASALLFGELELGCLEVVGKLFVGARPDYDRGHTRSAEQPRECHLCCGYATTFRDLDEHIYSVVELVGIVHRRLVPALQVAPLRSVLVAPVLPGEQTTGQGAPHEDGAFLVYGERHQLVLGLPGLQRVVDLLADVALQPEPLGDAQSLHHLPAGVVGRSHVAYLAALDECVERFQSLLQRGEAVPLMDLVEVDIVGAESPQALLALADYVVPRETGFVWVVSHSHAYLRCEE